jgi:hypothetical protein
VQKPREPDLAGSVLAQATHPHPAATQLHQTRVQEYPPFSRRRSPNRPRAISVIAYSSNRNHLAKGVRLQPSKQAQPNQRCVNVVEA